MTNQLEHEAGETSSTDTLIINHRDKLLEHFESVKADYEDDMTFEEWLGFQDTYSLEQIID